MAQQPWKVRVTADGAGTLDAVHATIELVDRAELAPTVGIYTTSDPDGHLTATDGIQTWTYTQANGTYAVTRTADGALFGEDPNDDPTGDTYAKVSADGTVEWTGQLAEDWHTIESFTAFGTAYYMGTGEDRAYVYRLDGGVVQWKTAIVPAFGSPPGWVESMAADATGVWAADSTGWLNKLSADGSTSTPLDAVGSVFELRKVSAGLLAAGTGGIQLLNASTGAAIWSSASSFTFYGIDEGADGSVYAGRVGRLHKVDPDGAAIWDVSLPGSTSIARVKIVDGTVVVVTDSRIMTVDPSDGTLLTDVPHGLTGVWQAD